MDGTTGKRLTKSASGLRMIPTAEKFSSPFALEEPMWIPDKEATKCSSCERVFDFMNRRHHCRRCGKCYCDCCCNYSISLKRMYFIDPVRQCYECAVISKKEMEFYEKTVAILMAGTVQNIVEQVVAADDKQWGVHMCRLSQDNRYIEFVQQTPGVTPPPRVLLTKVTGAQILTEPHMSGSQTRHVAIGLELKYKHEEDSSVVYDLVLKSVDQRASALWLNSIQKALKMIFESRQQNIQD